MRPTSGPARLTAVLVLAALAIRAAAAQALAAQEPPPPATDLPADTTTTRDEDYRSEDSNGNVAAQYSYGDFGTTTQVAGDPALYNPYRFTGQQYDSETGLYYLRARHYNPALGRFLSRDPAGGSNLFTYCGGDPIGRIDPSGLSWLTPTATLKVLEEQDAGTVQQPAGDVTISAKVTANDWGFCSIRLYFKAEAFINGDWQPITVTGVGDPPGLPINPIYQADTQTLTGAGDSDTVKARVSAATLANWGNSGATEVRFTVSTGANFESVMAGIIGAGQEIQATYKLTPFGTLGDLTQATPLPIQMQHPPGGR